MMKTYEPNEQWERLYAVIVWAKMNTRSFALHIGLPAAENLYRIKRGQNGISRNVAQLITGSFPQISRGWLLFGDGAMLRDDDRSE